MTPFCSFLLFHQLPGPCEGQFRYFSFPNFFSILFCLHKVNSPFVHFLRSFIFLGPSVTAPIFSVIFFLLGENCPFVCYFHFLRLSSFRGRKEKFQHLILSYLTFCLIRKKENLPFYSFVFSFLFLANRK